MKFFFRIETPLDSATRRWEVKVVRSPAVLKTFPTKVISLIGQPLNIPCYATGIPDPATRWTFIREVPAELVSRNEIESPPEHLKSVDLTLAELTPESAGFYVCEATNEFGKSELGVVVIGAHPTQPGPDFQNETVITSRAGDSVELGCDVIVDPVLAQAAPVRRFWEKDGKILVSYFLLQS